MEFILNNVVLPLEVDESKLPTIICRKLNVEESSFDHYIILKKTIEVSSKKKKKISFVFSLLVTLNRYYEHIHLLDDVRKNTLVNEVKVPKAKSKRKPVVVGLGWRGLFSSLFLARAGLKPIIIERGKKIEDRVLDLKLLEEKGTLNPSSNYVFGEGGRSIFELDGLNISDDYLKNKYILNELIKHGADESIYYQDRIYIPFDKMVEIISSIRKEIISLGGKFLFETTFLDYVEKNGVLRGVKIKDKEGNEKALHCDDLVLSIGHLARDTYVNLYNHELKMKPKDFGIGVKIEFLQEDYNYFKYDNHFDNKLLGNATFEEEAKLDDKRSVYTTNVVPRGRIIPCFTDENLMCLQSAFDSTGDQENISCSLLVKVNVEDFHVSSPLDGIYLQEMIEKAACSKINVNKAPCQKLSDFLLDKNTTSLGKIKPSYTLGTYFKRMDEVLPEVVTTSLRQGISMISKKNRLFKDPDGIILGVDTISSSPLLIERDEETLSSSIENLYPSYNDSLYETIVSKAHDGVNIAFKIIEKYIEE